MLFAIKPAPQRCARFRISRYVTLPFSRGSSSVRNGLSGCRAQFCSNAEMMDCVKSGLKACWKSTIGNDADLSTFIGVSPSDVAPGDGPVSARRSVAQRHQADTRAEDQPPANHGRLDRAEATDRDGNMKEEMVANQRSWETPAVPLKVTQKSSVLQRR